MRTSTLNRLAAATAVVLTCASAAPVLGQTPPQQGVNLTLWNSTVDLSDLATSLDRAKSDGVNSVNVNTFWFQSDINATTIGPGGWTNGGLVTATDQTVADVIAAIHQRGMSAVLKPIVVPANSNETGNWQGQIVGGDTWFNNPNGFRAMMNHNADLARQNNADGLVVGTELVATTSQSANWRNTISDVRSRYAGPLSYASVFATGASPIADSVDWWDALDYIGIDAYYPLTNSTSPSVAQLRNAWRNIATNIDAWRDALPANQRKPVLLTEIGFTSQNGTNTAPFSWTISTTPDQQEQADCYQVALSATLGHSGSIVGTNWWNWNVSPDLSPTNTDFPAQGKIAEHVMSLYYRGGASPQTSTLLKAALHRAYGDDFNRADSTTIGAAWTAAHGTDGVVSAKVQGQRVVLSVDQVDPGGWPYGTATIDFTNPSVLGRGLNPGEYVELGLQRLSGQGDLGVSLFGHALASDAHVASSDLRVWQNDQWNDAAGMTFDWSVAHTLGVRMDSADGEYAKLSIYVDGAFVGDWIYVTSSLTLNDISFLGQDNTLSTFAFDNLSIYTVVPEPSAVLMLVVIGSATTLRRRRRTSRHASPDRLGR